MADPWYKKYVDQYNALKKEGWTDKQLQQLWNKY